ncbi:hypothetical protein OW492_12280 [Psychromonas sp. 14N.309.X.WAT.B.A12]|uniref:hypothetical protein n=1 Tax=Psychromonas sp. 14N.309.X.WAT.B.A12 TaxID=2998322 RepID=UPI0025B01372|nr:hypothetical protein [Psychromonas sp. 14N.309.X.WAT.B.A12]MDN2664151.1 hypothetical protein [Psychromonas sp. 14N.309.X.WAT.B.A12]
MNSKDEPNKASESAQDTKSDTSEAVLSQLELIQQWRTTLMCLKKDVEFEITDIKDKENEQLTKVFEAVEYLDKKNTLLDENADFQFSDAGFLTYKTNHQLVFNYLSTLNKAAQVQSKSRFYFVSREKHIAQKLLPTHWGHSLIHFIFMLIVIGIIGFVSLLMFFKTQENLFVQLLLIWFCVANFKAIKQLISKYRKAAKTPFRFNISLLGIHCVNIFLKVCFLCFIPILITIKFNPYWVDDIVIISLFLVCLINFKLVDKPIENDVSKDLKEVEAANV